MSFGHPLGRVDYQGLFCVSIYSMSANWRAIWMIRFQILAKTASSVQVRVQSYQWHKNTFILSFLSLVLKKSM